MAAELTSIEPLRAIIATKPLGIFSDIDGTLAPIIEDPAAAAVSPRAKELLEGLIALGVRVALVSGREVEAARRIAGVDGAAYAGNHGLHLWVDGHTETTEAVKPYVTQARRVLAEIGSIRFPGVSIEDKGPVLAFHYRNAGDEQGAREGILSAIAGAAGATAFGTYEGRKVIELRPPLEINKGTAIVHLAERMGIRAAIAIGDDMTDVDMFRGVERLRLKGIPGANVAVWSDEATPDLLNGTDYFVRGVPGVEWLLEEILRALPG